MCADTLTLRVEKLSSNGEGIAFSEGKAVFLPYAMPGETALAEIIEEHSSFARARLINIEESSPYRVEPFCPHFGDCGGCSLQHIGYEYQALLKKQAAQETFIRIGGFDPGELQIITGESYHYRNRAQIHACGDGGLGFAKAGSHESIRISHCPALVPIIEQWLISENRKAHPYRALSALIGDRPRFVVFGQEDRLYIEGRDSFGKAKVAGKELKFPLVSFFQSNISMLEKLIARDFAPLHGKRALDLYCGAGLFSLFLAERFESIDCVESEGASVEAARMNLEPAKARIKLSCTTVEHWTEKAPTDLSFDCIVADPPRTGMAPQVRTWLSFVDAPVLLYISCDLASLARDLRDLSQKGWQLENIALYDFYPQTGRLEATAHLIKEAKYGP
ncbi:MAG: 23S rRNA (uracil(1939)-C(5))-methyltransferase RlmD [Spirochaetes bacterium ADurb.Bin110]|nr:MAG: 23S rRNA (uracil(1939)-C(5))-methyltransferase RlmD [Spirochaetes bacterium ADurb.Bin110]